MVSGSDSRIKKNKQGVSFAKDPKQAAMAVVAFILLVVVGVHSMMQINSQSSAPIDTKPVAPQTTDPNAPTVPTNSTTNTQNMAQDANKIYSQTMNMQGNQQGTTAQQQANGVAPNGNVEILPRKNGKMVDIVVGDSGRLNPFLPPSEIPNASPARSSGGSVKRLAFPHLTPPPQEVLSHSDASKVMTTQISGILYDQYSPSAIINIEGTDYLVKRGDVVNHYRVLSISKTQVIVQLGKNVYKAGVGQLLTPTNIGANAIANLNKKFGGNSVTIRVKKSKKG